MGLVRRLRLSLQRGVDLESSRVLRRNSSTHVDNPSCAHASTDDGHYHTGAGTHVDVQL
jgi:hypothetical protein